VADLLVFLEGKLAGEISAAPANSVEFRYDDTYLRNPRNTPLSLSAPLGRGTYEMRQWLDGLLPDNIAVRRRWAARRGASSARPLDLLSTSIGLDCAGAVQFSRPGAEGVLHARASGLEPQSERQIADWIRAARQDWSAWEGLSRAIAERMSSDSATHSSTTGRSPRPTRTPRTTACFSMGPTCVLRRSTMSSPSCRMPTMTCLTCASLWPSATTTRCGPWARPMRGEPQGRCWGSTPTRPPTAPLISCDARRRLSAMPSTDSQPRIVRLALCSLCCIRRRRWQTELQ